MSPCFHHPLAQVQTSPREGGLDTRGNRTGWPNLFRMNKVSREKKKTNPTPTPGTVPNTRTQDKFNGDVTRPANRAGGARRQRWPGEDQNPLLRDGDVPARSPLGTGTATETRRHGAGGENRATRHDTAGSGRRFRGWRGRESRDAAEDRESCSGTRGEPSPPWILPHHLCCLGFGIFHSLGEENGQVRAKQPPSQGSESKEHQGEHRPAPHPNSTP